jgi:hypothetical protein
MRDIMRKQQSLIILVAMLPIFMTLASAITAQSVKGAEPVIMRRYRRVDDRAFEFVSKTDGKVTTSSKVVISGDGRTQTVTTTGRNPRGIAVNDVAVYEKQ